MTGAAGHVDFGENYVEAVIREAEEEVGLRLENVTFLSKTFGEYPGNRRRFTAIFMAVVDFEVEDLTISKDEVEQVRLVSFSELGRMIKSSEMNFTKYSLSNLAENQEKIVEFLSTNKIEA
ncbi:MAG: NUDIX hydrolase [bacterium]|nr:NUDIX hydrolase [bacterium]